MRTVSLHLSGAAAANEEVHLFVVLVYTPRDFQLWREWNTVWIHRGWHVWKSVGAGILKQ